MNWRKKMYGLARQAEAEGNSDIYFGVIRKDEEKRKAMRKRERANRRQNRKSK